MSSVASFNDLVSDSKCANLHCVVETAAGKYLCFTRLDSETWTICASDGYDLWKIDLSEKDFETHRELADIKEDAYLLKFRYYLMA